MTLDTPHPQGEGSYWDLGASARLLRRQTIVNTVASNLTRIAPCSLLAAALTALGCAGQERTTIPGGVAEPDPVVDIGEPVGGGIDTSAPEALEVVDFAADSNLALAQIGHPGSMTRDPSLSRYVDIAGVLQLTGVGGVNDSDIALDELADDGSATGVAIDIVRSYDNATAWILPRALLTPGVRHKLHVTAGTITGTQAFRTQMDVGAIEAGAGVALGGVTAALHLRATGAVHPVTQGVGEAFLDSLGLLLAAGGAQVQVEANNALKGAVEVTSFLSNDFDMDGAPDSEDLATGMLQLTGQVHGHYVWLQAKVGDEVVLTVTGRLRLFDDGTWRLMGGAAVVDAACDLFPSAEAQAACDGDRLAVVSQLKGETVYLSGLQVAAEASWSGQGEGRMAVVELTKPRWVGGKDLTADQIDLSGGVRAEVLVGELVHLDSMAGAALVAEAVCGQEGCFLNRVGLVVGDEDLSGGLPHLRVTIGLQQAQVRILDEEPEVGDGQE